MTEPKDPLLLDHEADGIRELDNKLPRWWVWLFNLTIVFSVIYLAYYHVFAMGDLMVAEWQKENTAGEAIKAVALARFEKEMESLQPSTDPLVVNQGKQTFAMLCAPCHRADGGGQVGPNLTDDFWIHGSAFKDNLRIIYNGVPDKGMLTWKTILKPAEIHAVGSYIHTLRGAKLEKPGKPPENQTPAPTGPSAYE